MSFEYLCLNWTAVVILGYLGLLFVLGVYTFARYYLPEWWRTRTSSSKKDWRKLQEHVNRRRRKVGLPEHWVDQIPPT